MPKFQPSFSFWPTPQFRGDESLGFFAWLGRQQSALDRTRDIQQAEKVNEQVKKMVDDHHDRHAHTVGR